MAKKFFPPSFLLYGFLSLLIFGWWTLAFNDSPSFKSSSILQSKPSLPLTTHKILNSLSQFDRNTLHDALLGNTHLMLDLMIQWDQDTQILQHNFEIEEVQRLNEEEFFKANLLGRLILSLPPHQLQKINSYLRKPFLIDAINQKIPLKVATCRYLPQTYMSAHFLLAIAHPSEILAIPKGLRTLKQLYHKKLLDQIPLNADRLGSEKLFASGPILAFVAPYSNPATLQAFTKQNIPVYHAPTIRNIPDIQNSLLEIGHACNHSIEAQFLSTFIKAGLYAIDNRLKALSAAQTSKNQNRKLLYLCHTQQYFMPTVKCLTGQLLTRAVNHVNGFTLSPSGDKDWMIPFDYEKIMRFNPDCLILSIANAAKENSRIKHQRTLHHLPACRNNQIAFVDESLQDSPTQFVVLAYYDLYACLVEFILGTS